MLRIDRDGPVVTLTLDRPERRNALSDVLLERLAEALAGVRDDPAARVLVLTGAPPVFCAGAEAPFRRGMSDEERRRAFAASPGRFIRLFPRVQALLADLEIPSIAMVNGHAVGGGWALALACDLRIAADTAQFWIPEVDLGIPLAVELTVPFVRLAGPARAKEIVMEGRRYSAEEAAACGLVDRVVPAAELAAAVRDAARKLAARPARALAVARTRIEAIAQMAFPAAGISTEGLLARD